MFTKLLKEWCSEETISKLLQDNGRCKSLISAMAQATLQLGGVLSKEHYSDSSKTV